MHLILVEDMDMNRNELADLIRQNCSLHGEPAELSFYKSGEEFSAAYQPSSCSTVFLDDIFLDGISGLDTARKIREIEPHLPIVFTTIEPDFALDSFSIHAMDYLLKPVKPARHLMPPRAAGISGGPGQHHHPGSDQLGTLCACGYYTLDHILYGQCWNHKMNIHTVSGVLHARFSFQNFTSLLPQNGRFHICGRDLVVNLSQIRQIEDGVLLLIGGERLAFRRRREVQDALNEWSWTCMRREGWETYMGGTGDGED